MDAWGWIYHGEVVIDKDPQAQAIRIRAKGLAFQQLHKDASWMRPALADYILLFRKPGDNPVPIVPDVDNDTWIQWARPIWYGIKETDTLNAAEARDHADDRHICPLQLGVIERCIRLWSNPNETICDPFSGIGSTGFVALQHGRRYVGCELKPSYAATQIKNLAMALQSQSQQRLF
jgi:DNA modification methylase